MRRGLVSRGGAQCGLARRPGLGTAHPTTRTLLLPSLHSPSVLRLVVLEPRPFDSKFFKMSYIARRGLSTLIPPKIASPNAIGAAQDAARMDRVVNFYARLPRGAAPETKATGILGRYQARYFNGKNASAAPLAHAIGGILIVGYSLEYYFHLRHHKNHPH